MPLRELLFYEQFLWRTALDAAVSRGYYFGRDCEFLFRKVIRRGARTLHNQGEVSDQQLKEAATTTVKLVNEMISNIEARGLMRKRLRESSLAWALKNLCPLFPFC